MMENIEDEVLTDGLEYLSHLHEGNLATPSPLKSYSMTNSSSIATPVEEVSYIDNKEAMEKCKTPEAFLTILGVELVAESDEILLILDVYKDKKDKEKFPFFYNFVACLTALGISPNATTEQGLWELYGTGALEVLQNYPKKEHTRRVIFRNLHNKTWPEGFVEYMTQKYGEVPSADWCAKQRITDYSEERKKQIYFGSKMHTAFQTIKRHINNVLNPIWNTLPEVIPSGVTKSTLLYWLRSKAWPTEALELAKGSIRQKRFKQLKSTKLEDFAEEVTIHANKRMFKPVWFPDSWLVFVYLGYTYIILCIICIIYMYI